jgi:hypothetical protein
MSTLRVTTVTNPSGGQPTIDGLARAWVNFNGTGTVAIRASLNVSSITDNGTGNYTVNFTTAMPDANYSLVQGGGEVNTSTLYSGSTAARIMQPGVLSASNAQFFTGYQYSSSALQDAAYIYLAVFR